MAPQSFRLFGLTYRSTRSWLAIFLAVCCLSITANAQNIQKRGAGVKVVSDGVGTASLSEDCPDQHGIITAFSVPVQQPGGGPIHIVIFIDHPAPPGGYYFKVVVEDPRIAAVGNPLQGLQALVYIPAGKTDSNPYYLYGNKVGKTVVDVLPQTHDVAPWKVPTAVWDINPTADPEVGKWLDANPSDLLTCRDPGSPDMSSDPNKLIACGLTAKGTVSDGVSKLLMRLEAGLPGIGCFQVASKGPPDQGTIEKQVLHTQTVVGAEAAFSFYQAPKNGYGIFEDPSHSRLVKVQFAFTPKDGFANTSYLVKTLTVIRPPLVLIHGLWGSSDSFSSSLWTPKSRGSDEFYYTEKANYKAKNASSFSTNFPRVQGFIYKALQEVRDKHYAATQADVVGHSMGGLLTRLYAGSDQFKRWDNFALGDVHRLVTLDTPHFGSSLANLLVSLNKNSGDFQHGVLALREALARMGFETPSIYGGAVCDLAENSPALQGLSGGPTELLSWVITANPEPGASDGGPYYGLIERLLTFPVCSPSFYDNCIPSFLFPQDIVNGFRFRQDNDGIVPLNSQRGGRGGTNYGEPIHTKVQNDPDVIKQVFQWLDSPDSRFYPSLPPVLSDGKGHPLSGPGGVPGLGESQDEKDYSDECGPGGPMNGYGGLRKKYAADPRVQVISPVNGQQFAPGDIVNATVQLTPPLVAHSGYLGAEAPGLGLFEGTNYNGSTYQASFVLPNDFAGPLDLTPDITDSDNRLVEGPTVTIAVRPTTPPLSLSLVEGNYNHLLSAKEAANVYVTGNYNDQVQLNLTSSVTGTTYESSDKDVLTVDKEGNVQATGFGTAVVTVQNRGVQAFSAFAVEDPNNPLPPQDPTADLTINRSGFRIDRITGFYVQTIEFTNSQPVPLIGPLYFAVTGLTSGVTIVDAGSTQNIQPAGSPYFSLDPADGITFQPGERLDLTLQFEDGNRLPINYTPKVFRTLANP
jgi:pimeloyl-ACP methyl ester carboxylesterase